MISKVLPALGHSLDGPRKKFAKVRSHFRLLSPHGWIKARITASKSNVCFCANKCKLKRQAEKMSKENNGKTWTKKTFGNRNFIVSVLNSLISNRKRGWWTWFYRRRAALCARRRALSPSAWSTLVCVAVTKCQTAWKYQLERQYTLVETHGRTLKNRADREWMVDRRNSAS